MSTRRTFGLLMLVISVRINVGDNSDLERSCYASDCSPETGQGLLQVRRSSSVSMVNYTKEPVYDGSGYLLVRALCCTQKMLEFVKGLIKSEGKYTLCHEGGLAGTIKYYDCEEDDPAGNDFIKLTTIVFPEAADPSGKCPWLVNNGDKCEKRKTTCETYPGVPFPPCDDDDDYICCGSDNGYQENDPLLNPSTSKITPWDCKVDSGPVQLVYKPGGYDVSVLDLVNAPTYRRLWRIPLAITRPGTGKVMDSRMNAAALNPIDNIAYAVVSITERKARAKVQVYYIVRFGYMKTDEIEYVARLAPLADWSGTVTDKNNIYVGAMTLDGTYYLGGLSKRDDGTDILRVPDIAAKPGYAKTTDAALPTWGKTGPDDSLYWVKLDSATSDIAIAKGKFDGTESEWLFMLRGNDFLLGMAKLPEMTFYTLKQVQPSSLYIDPSTTTTIKDFGAAWAYQDQVYFSRNNGDGVYHIRHSSINLVDLTYQMEKVVEQTPQTRNNDGLNCVTTKSPFPDECEAPDFEVDPVNGECPAGSKKVKKTP